MKDNITVNVGDIYNGEKVMREIGNTLKELLNKSVSNAHSVNSGWTGSNSELWVAKFDEYKPKIEALCDAIITMADGLKKSADRLTELQQEASARIKTLGTNGAALNNTGSSGATNSSPEVKVTNVSDAVDSTVVKLVKDGEVIGYTQIETFKAQSYGQEYTDEQFMQLAAIVGGEDSGSYDGALAVASTMCNRADAGNWGGGNDPLEVAKAPNQFVAYNGELYNKYMSDPSSIPDYVVQATKDALGGTRNTTAVEFRGGPGTKGDRVQIGKDGNYYFIV